jgi:hypothetical protein
MKYKHMILSNVGHNIRIFPVNPNILLGEKIGQGISILFLIFWAKREETWFKILLSIYCTRKMF